MVYIRGQSFKGNAKGGVFILEDKGRENRIQRKTNFYPQITNYS